MASCDICDRLLASLRDPNAERKKIDLGSFEDALASDCQDHTPIIKRFKEHCDASEITFNKPPGDVGFDTGLTGQRATLYQSIGNLGMHWELFLAKKEDDASHPGVGRILDPDWANLDLIRQWKHECISSHDAKCDNPMKIRPTSPPWLIDVQDKCIVAGGNAKSYVALSYRSSDDRNNAKKPGLAELQKKNALESPELLSKIPLKIVHAMALTAAMDERYLWADSLCFDYSDPTAMGDQLNLMTSIYASAVVTIVDADGDRTDGISGIKGVSTPRKLNQKVFPLRDERLIVRNSGAFSLEHGQGHDYYKRGWTYQEFKMSPRKLIFLKGQIHWQCNCSVLHEEVSTQVDTYIDPRPLVCSAGFPDLGSLGHMLANYNERELTYDEDALAAISGLLALFSRSFTGGFLYGLPEMLFDRALAWKPQWSHTNMRKRKSSGKPSHIRFKDSDLPTWSWVGWQGYFNHGYGEAVRINDRQHWFQEVTPITEWYTSSAPSGKPFRRIRSTWFDNRESWKDVNQPLPEGWTRLPAPVNGEFRNEPMLYPDGCGQYVYKHDALPDNDCKTWYYPFPVPKIDFSTPYSMPEQTRYLFCKTWKVPVWSHRTNENFQYEDDNHILALRSSHDGPRIGILHLQTDDQMTLWPPYEEEKAGSIESGKTVDVVAINRCVHYSKTFDKEQQRYDHPLERSERMTVLLVEWEDGVAYRLACGHVDKEAWDSLAPEAIDLVLG